MLELLIPLFCILLGVIGLTVYILVIALKDALRQIVKINEQLLIMASSKDGDPTTGRMLLASAKQPKKAIPGLAKKEEKPKDDKPKTQFTVGYR